MRKMVTALGAALAISLGGMSVHAAEPAGEAAGAEAKAKPDKSKKVCRTIVKSGTRFSQRHCRSQEDWDKDAETAGRYLEEGQWNGTRRDGEMNTQSGVSGGPR